MLDFKKNKSCQVVLITKDLIEKGVIVIDLQLGELSKNRTLRTIELGPELHIDNPWGRYTNHSCNPNCFIDKETKSLKALREIKSEEEITFNYLNNETELSNSFHCLCEDVTCLGFIDKKSND